MSQARKTAQKRNHYRINYPEVDRPSFECFKTKHIVIDLSESGMKIEWNSRNLPLKSQQVSGMVSFGDRGSVEVVGDVIRVQGRTVIIELTQGIPLDRIISEQRFLINKNGTL